MLSNAEMISFLGADKARFNPRGEEDKVTIEIANYFRELTLTGKANFIWFHVANEIGNGRQYTFGAKLRAMGKMPGCSDFVLIGKNGGLCLEVKSAKGKIGPNQKIFNKWCNSLDVPYAVVRSVQETKEVLKEIEL